MKKVRIAIYVFLSLLVLSFILMFAFRESILHKIIDKVIASEKRKHQLEIKIENASFVGLSAVEFKNISVVPDSADTLLRINQFKVRVAILPLFIGHVKIDELISSDAVLNIVNKNGKRNFDFLLKNKEPKDTVKKDQSGLDLARLADNLVNDLLYKVPNNMSIKNYKLQVIDDDLNFSINAEDISIDDHQLNSTFVLNNRESIWHLDGSLYPSDKKLNVRFYAENKKVELPYLEQKMGLKLSFDTVSTRMDKIEYSGDELRIFGNWALKNLSVNHPKIAQKDVLVNAASIECNMFIGEKSISIDSSSMAFLGAIKARPYLKYTIAPTKIYELKFDINEMPAQDFFNSFPQGLFSTLEGIQVQGNLGYHLNFYLDEKEPWKCKFNSGLSKSNFSIVKFGETNLQRMNADFVHTPYEFGRASRPIYVGASNPNFTPYDQISDYIKNALLTTEDPLFFSHRGFYEEAFRQSIATNFVAKRFKRGGSTISMQLVKNVFLSRNKTVARKLEEMIIVWLIENNRLTSKQRMYEVYLNIIEWAPDVYGITEAAHFYFNKKPSQLNLGESIFLASIVPKPKKFKYSFLADGTLKPYMRNYFRFIGGLMVRRGKVPASDTVDIFNSVVLRGIARNYVVVDSLQIIPESEEEMQELKSLLESE
jgi:hypothetical protein